MTVIDELLVLLDDGKARTLDECSFMLPKRTRQTLSSTLGRLTAKGWVKTTKDRLRRINTYEITTEGQERVTRTLDHLRIADDESWDGHWLFVLFNIPEKSRKYRDILRNRLCAIGFGRVQNSVWITARDISFELEDLLEIEAIKRSTTIIKPQLSDTDSLQLVSSFEWNWSSLSRTYQQFIEVAESFTKKAPTDADSFEARTLVYCYAKLLSQDPKFPSKYEPKEYPRQQAHQAYLKVRPYCYEPD